MPNTVDVTDISFSDVVSNTDKPVVVAFWAPWCGPCRRFAPILDVVAGEHAAASSSPASTWMRTTAP